MAKRIYGQWAGDPKGRSEDEACCIAEIWGNDRWSRGYQCQRKRGYGTDGLYCKQHAKKSERHLTTGAVDVKPATVQEEVDRLGEQLSKNHIRLVAALRN